MDGLVNQLFSVLNSIDQALGAVGLNAALRVTAWSVVSGTIVMGLYALLSRQATIRAKKERIRALRSQMRTEDDPDLKQILRLSTAQLRESLALLKMLLLPSVLSTLPVVVLIMWLSTSYSHQSLLDGVPGWMTTWEVLYFAVLTATGLAMKVGFKLE